MIKLRNIILFCFGLVLYSCSSEEIFYISTEGSDQGDGTKSSPFASLEQAKVALKDTRKKTVRIILREGYYQFEKSFVLNTEDIGDRC